MHRVLPGCTYGCIPKVQGARDVSFVSPGPAVLEPRAPFTSKGRFTRRAHGEEKRTQGRQVSYSVFSVRHTLHGSHGAGLVDENGRCMFRRWWTTMSAC